MLARNLGRDWADLEDVFATGQATWSDDSLYFFARRLLAHQYEVIAVEDGAAALAATREQQPDLVLADVMMPRLDGFGLLKELRVDPHTRTIPLILLSARADEESRVEGLEAGADDYLVKPFGARELLAQVGATLKLARVREEAMEVLKKRETQLREAQRLAHLGSWESGTWPPIPPPGQTSCIGSGV